MPDAPGRELHFNDLCITNSQCSKKENAVTTITENLPICLSFKLSITKIIKVENYVAVVTKTIIK